MFKAKGKIVDKEEFAYEVDQQPEYFVTRSGKVYSKRNCYKYSLGKQIRRLKTSPDAKGYPTIAMTFDTLTGKQRKTIKVHRLVLSKFIPNTENKQQINHIDGDKRNNHVSNLEWCTQTENQIHAVRTGLHGSRYDICPVEQYDLDGNLMGIYSSQKEAGRITGVFNTSISACIRGKSRTAGGYVWRKVAKQKKGGHLQ